MTSPGREAGLPLSHVGPCQMCLYKTVLIPFTTTLVITLHEVDEEAREKVEIRWEGWR